MGAAGFKEENIAFIGQENIRGKLPTGSRNLRYYCRICDDYIGENAMAPLGLYMLPLRGASNVHESYLPNHHIFYDFRVQDITDELPKWSTLPDGKVAPSARFSENRVSFKYVYILLHYVLCVKKNYCLFFSFFARTRKDVQPLGPTRAPESKVIVLIFDLCACMCVCVFFFK